MGVPKFFRYTSERYPCLNELVKQYQIPDFDNMYLDMNGIIHNCSHPDDSDPHFRITEEKIFSDIFHYLSVLFQIIKPRKLFFMAIDGVAPRAKMNQQRGRRFRSAKEAENLEEEAKKKGEVLPTEKRFDSNCITPGTVFMARLHEQLKYFVKSKMSTDPLWAKVKVILSGHETPGEGEHKIMDYIRWARSQPDYDPNTRHCLYGLDADLIMLGMCTHEPHFALLREEVKFGKTTQRATSPEETNFYLLHLSLLREYLEQEFIGIKDKLPFEYDIEKIVDDWVLMGFLVGNDFIPNLPNMHISNDALPLLYKTYMDVLPTLDGYINEAGDLNLRRFEAFMKELAKIDKEKFQDTYADLKYFEAKTGRRPNANERKEYKPNNDDTFNVDVDEIKANKPDDELQALISATEDMFFDDVGGDDDDDAFEDIDSSDEEATFNMEFVLHKKDYYMNKLDYSKVTPEVLASQAECYVRAIQWNLYYYYRGCASWCWYYPHHYAPYISDIKDFSHLDLQFELGEPFKPFEQLLAVLPAASKQLLPAPFHDLMTDEDSPIVHYYPINFETDLNGKRNDWEAVVLIPFIDETNLLSAMTPCYQRLTDEERKRNTHGPMMLYQWTADSQGIVEAPDYFPPIRDCHAMEKPIYRQELEVPLSQLKRGMLPNASRDLVFPGFPTMRHLKYETTVKKCKVKVFDQPSRNENMIIQLIRESQVDPVLDKVAQNLLGRVIWVGWPHLTKAKVISVSNEKQRLHHVDAQNHYSTGPPRYSSETNKDNLHKQWISERSTIIEHNMNRLGIELGDVNIIVHAVNLKGYKYIIQDNTQMVLEPEWCSVACGYALQAIVCNVNAYVADVTTKFATPQEAYPTGENVFLLTQGQYYGCLAKVVDSESIRSGRIKVQVSECEEPVPSVRGATTPYRTAHHAAASCGISTQVLSRITGCIFVVPGERNNLPTEQIAKLNIGLNLKFNKKNLEVSGFTRRCPLTNAWLYSARCVALVASYVEKFPELFDTLAQSVGNDVFFEGDLFPGEVDKKKPQDIVAWLKKQPHQTAVRRECGSEALEPEEMLALAASLDKQLATLQQKQKTVTLHVKWNLLYKPDLHEGSVNPDPKADFKMYDRVVCVSKTMTVPLGAKGTITAIHMPGNSNTVRLSDKLNVEASYQVLFDEPFSGAMKEELFDVPRHYRMQPSNMLNISFGRKLRQVVTAAKVDEAFMYAPRNSKPNNFMPNSSNQPNNFKPNNSNQPNNFKAKNSNKPNTSTPNVLRREDGHHSAFASYSPTKDRQTPVVESPNPCESSQDSSTLLLKSLLKISQDESVKSNAKPATPKQPPQNWRMKSEQAPPAVPSPQKPQLVNWRTENSASVTNNSRMQPPVPTEWSNTNFKGQPPVPPFPTFPQPALPLPQTTQIPFPQFQNPPFQQRTNDGFQRHPTHPNQPHATQPHVTQPHATQPHATQPHPSQNQPSQPLQAPFGHQNNHPANYTSQNSVPFANPSNQHHQMTFGNQIQYQSSFSQNGQFSMQVVSVSSNVTLAPSWNKGPGQVQAMPTAEQAGFKPPQPTNPPAEKTNNPFVPLQVVASQRRVQNQGGPAHQKKNQSAHAARAEAPAQPPQHSGYQKPFEASSASSRPQRKKKPRIAANLPFQTE